ncbi:hypothetical protein B5G26_02645 [Anaerotignum lactatifermentans]|uniref:Uncharacterized protein n=1 Tax=Anaerotignum lactatifermentans TaxID=160404 RepID=A0A1Y3UAW8_9FIRM|nr:hypothetical protein B5G26_02645 [Anaerotignum lactatifermentans]
MTCHLLDGIYKTKVECFISKHSTQSYHRRILFTDFSSYPLKGRFEASSPQNITLYYDYTDHTHYKKSRFIYWGHGHIEGNMVNLFLQNQKHNIEYCVCSARIPIVNDNYVYGFISGLSPSAMVPIFNKFLISPKPLPCNENLLQLLSFTKEEFHMAKKNNTISLSLEHLSLLKF